MTHRCSAHADVASRLSRCELKVLTTERDITAAAAEIRKVAEDFLAGQNGLVKEMHALMERFAEIVNAHR